VKPINGSDKLNALRQREADLRAKIANEIKLQQKSHWREYDRLRTIIGGALIAEDNPDFKLMLKQALGTAALSPGDLAFLKSKNWQ
jgi:hypothetical protein